MNNICIFNYLIINCHRHFLPLDIPELVKKKLVQERNISFAQEYRLHKHIFLFTRILSPFSNYDSSPKS